VSDDALTDPAPVTGPHPGGPRREDPPFPAVADAVADRYAAADGAHDLGHAWRVFATAGRLADELPDDPGADGFSAVDRTVAGTAALVHDLHRVAGVDPRDSLGDVAATLAETPVDDATAAAVREVVAGHDDYAFRGEAPEPPSAAAAVVWDADNLDAVGAVGVARTFAFGGASGSPLWDPDGEDYSQLYHFEDKLLKLREELHTAPARAVAADRHAFLERFHERFRAEWAGER